MHQDSLAALPVRAALHATGLYLAMRPIASTELRDAFMQQTIERVAAPETIVHISRDEIGKVGPDTAPAGLIFHVARCGSTLISQLLKENGNLVVYAEPLPVNEILLPPHKWPRHELIAALRTLSAAFAQHARGPYVLKFSSWNTLFCDIVCEAFPDSPWVLSFRDPVEVGVSLLNQLPGWLQETTGAASQLAKCVDPQAATKSREEFVARLYGAFCNAVAHLDATRGKLVPYEALPAAVWEMVAPHFLVAIASKQRIRMAQAARNYSKAPVGQPAEFASDIAIKQSAASTVLRGAIDAFARPALERLIKLHAS